MRVENQVISLEIAKRLKELGVKQESLFAWRHNVDGTYQVVHGLIGGTKASYDWASDIFIAAFTVAELGEFLPAFNPDSTPFQQLHCRKNRNSKGDEWSVVYYNQNKQTFSPFIFFADTEADARGKMLIYLLENNLTK